MSDLDVPNQTTQIYLCSFIIDEGKIVNNRPEDCEKTTIWSQTRWYATNNRVLLG